MGNAAIWWEPNGAEVVRKIDLGRALTSLQWSDPRDARTSLTPGGRLSSVSFTAYSQIQIRARFTEVAIHDELQAMINRLKRGGRITLAEDDEAVSAGFIDPWIVSDELPIQRSPWHLYGGDVAVGDRLVVTGPSPQYRQETVTVTTIPIQSVSSLGGTVGVDTRRNDWSSIPFALARNHAFWPVLRMSPADYPAQLIQHKGQRIVYELVLTLDEDVGGIEALSTTPTVTLQGTTDTGKPTLTEAILLAGG